MKRAWSGDGDHRSSRGLRNGDPFTLIGTLDEPVSVVSNDPAPLVLVLDLIVRKHIVQSIQVTLELTSQARPVSVRSSTCSARL